MIEGLPPKENMWLRTFGGLLIAVVIAGLLFPAVSIHRDGGDRKSEAKTAVVGLSAALKAYYTEYGKWPDFTGNGLFVDEKRQAQLMRTLCGKDEASNPRKIVFFEGKIATKKTSFSDRYSSGFHPETGVFLDTWGNPYRIAIDADYNEQITNPYSDDPAVQRPVIVWSLGKDGKQGSPTNPHTFKGSDDVTSWQ